MPLVLLKRDKGMIKTETYIKIITEVIATKKNCSARIVIKIRKKAKEKAAITNTIPIPPVKNPPRIIKIRFGTDRLGPKPRALASLQSSTSQTSR